MDRYATPAKARRRAHFGARQATGWKAWWPPACCALLVGCGTTTSSDTKRTATEQLLISDAIERAVMRFDAEPLAGHTVFLKTTMLSGVTEEDYLSSTVRHQLLGAGCVLADKEEQADIIVEARAGAIGTDRNTLMIGIPSTELSFAGTGANLPEMSLMKRTDQRGVAKVNLFAYHRTSGRPLWQGGSEKVVSNSRDRWIFGAGPVQDGRIHDRISFAGSRLGLPAPPWRRKQDEALAQAFDQNESRTFAALDELNRAARTADERPVSLPPVR